MHSLKVLYASSGQVSYGGCYVYVLKYAKKTNKFKQSLSNFEPWMAGILSNSEGWGPTKVAYLKNKCM